MGNQYTKFCINIWLMVYSGLGVTFYISEYGDVRALLVYFSALPLYDKVCFSISNYMNSSSFHSSHYFNSQKNYISELS